MDDALGPLLVAVIGAVGALVIGVVKALSKKRVTRPPPAQPSPSGAHRGMEPDIAGRLDRLDARQQEAQVQAAREGAQDAEARRVLADVSVNQHGIARAVELVHRDGTRERAELKAMIERLEDRLRSIHPGR